MIHKKYGRGWHNESYRHSLASRGIKTKNQGLGFIFKKGYKPRSGLVVHNPNYSREFLKGGLSDNKPDFLFSKRQLRMGIKVEMNHTDNPLIAKEIAKDHLKEHSQYYSFLKQMKRKMRVNYALKFIDPIKYKLGSVQWQNAILFNIKEKTKHKEKLSDFEKTFIKLQKEHNKRINFSTKQKYFNIKTVSPSEADLLHDKLSKNRIDSVIYDWGKSKVVSVPVEQMDKVKKLFHINFQQVTYSPVTVGVSQPSSAQESVWKQQFVSQTPQVTQHISQVPQQIIPEKRPRLEKGWVGRGLEKEAKVAKTVGKGVGKVGRGVGKLFGFALSGLGPQPGIDYSKKEKEKFMNYLG